MTVTVSMNFIKLFLFFLFSLFFHFPAQAQFVRVYGYVTEAGSGEVLPQATVYDSLSRLGTVTNAYGYYSLRIPAGKAALRISYVGYQTLRLVGPFTADTLVNTALPSTIALQEVVVTESIGRRNPISTLNIPVGQLKQVPMLAGEPDIIKALALTPGVSTGVEGSTGLFIRGAAPTRTCCCSTKPPCTMPPTCSDSCPCSIRTPSRT
jgi:hypothetical protein